MNVGRVMGVGRWGVVGGVVLVGLGPLVGVSAVSWAGVAVVVLAFAVNAVGKALYYGGLDVAGSRTALVVGAWALFGLTLAGLVGDYTQSQFAAAYESRFWALFVATAGFAAVYYGLRRQYLPDDLLAETDGEAGR